MEAFIHNTNPARVVFGAGQVQRLGDEVERLGCSRTLVVCTPGRAEMAETLSGSLGSRRVGIHAKARMHVPIETAEAGRAVTRELNADSVVSIGGGSAIGLGKAIALECDIPLLSVVTTYSGSEMTSACGMVEGGRKVQHHSPRMLPRVVIYDSELTVNLPPAISGPSGFNAIAHSVGSMYRQSSTPMLRLTSLDGIRAMASALPRIMADPSDLEARDDALYGAWLCGMAAGSGARSIHHKLAHVVGGSFDLPHAESHTILLPHSTAYNADVEPDAMTAIADALGAKTAPQGLYELEKSVGTPTALKDIGMPEAGLDRAADEAMENSYPNPRPLDRAAIRVLLENAWHGNPPVTV
ncbi:MAG: iron-containing alcohol dehydrogenase [Alphaproteobacteria bacterium]|nr:iron-containing alcohol dehydrogenase [Alphaproteobacteria bacterium]